MSARRRKEQRRGHFCWSCEWVRPNEKFSGRNRSRHLCRHCSKLGDSELKYRQEVRNLERLVTWDGIVPRKQRKAFEAFLSHPNPRVREYAAELAALDVEARKLSRALQDEWRGIDEDESEIDFRVPSLPEEDALGPMTDGGELEEDEIPF